MQSARYAGPPLFARGHNRRTVALAAVPLVIGIGIGLLIGGGFDSPTPRGTDTAATPRNEPVQLEYSDMPCDPGSSVLVLHSLEGAMSAEEVKVLLDYEALWVRYRSAANPALRDQSAFLSRRDDVCTAIVPDDTRFAQFIWVGPFPSVVAPGLCDALLKVPGRNCIAAQVVR
ncbi:hypothetical protein SAMN05216553_105284 [Lentzea fradiae]|uniref:Uncharacterized protein n=1 Tax=Lentzea fradiae TaxID=200378 RepID=A0A1G7RFX4_9PSEU|nr:hypothetical protein [Lentzea fradiae]SDG09039.1 hypothetical protein SAMN05216553_105284 [Lentzea fradiae]